jgi:hypothetical protein
MIADLLIESNHRNLIIYSLLVSKVINSISKKTLSTLVPDI